MRSLPVCPCSTSGTLHARQKCVLCARTYPEYGGTWPAYEPEPDILGRSRSATHSLCRPTRTVLADAVTDSEVHCYGVPVCGRFLLCRACRRNKHRSVCCLSGRAWYQTAIVAVRRWAELRTSHVARTHAAFRYRQCGQPSYRSVSTCAGSRYDGCAPTKVGREIGRPQPSPQQASSVLTDTILSCNNHVEEQEDTQSPRQVTKATAVTIRRNFSCRRRTPASRRRVRVARRRAVASQRERSLP